MSTEVRAPLRERFDEILTDDALAFVGERTSSTDSVPPARRPPAIAAGTSAAVKSP